MLTENGPFARSQTEIGNSPVWGVGVGVPGLGVGVGVGVGVGDEPGVLVGSPPDEFNDIVSGLAPL